MTGSRMWSFWALIALCGGLFCGLPRGAQAQDLSIYQQEVRELFEAGKTLSRDKQHKRALVKFMLALTLAKQLEKNILEAAKKRAYQNKRAVLLFVIGHEYVTDQQWYRAYLFFRRCLALNPPEALKRRATGMIRKVMPKILIPCSISSDPAGAKLVLKNAEGKAILGTTPMQIKLLPGAYRVFLSKPGFPSFRGEFVLLSSLTAFQSPLYQLGKSHPVLNIDSTPTGAKVVVSNAKGTLFEGTTPLKRWVVPGRYKVELSLRDYETETMRLHLKSGQEWSKQISLRSSPVEVVIEVVPRQASYRLVTPKGRSIVAYMPLRTKLPPGDYVLYTTAPGYFYHKFKIKVEHGSNFYKRITFRKAPWALATMLTGLGTSAFFSIMLGVGLSQGIQSEWVVFGTVNLINGILATGLGAVALYFTNNPASSTLENSLQKYKRDAGPSLDSSRVMLFSTTGF